MSSARSGDPTRPHPIAPAVAAATDETIDAPAFPDLSFLPPPLEPGELGRLAQYRILRLLGAGGMGIVFEAEDTHLRRAVALKVLRPELAAELTNRTRFLNEARAAAALASDHIVTVYQVGQDHDVPFLAMQLLHGEPLDARLAREPRLPVADAVVITAQAATGLAAAHDMGLVHRDVKPGNLWLEADRPGGEFRRVRVLDLGLVRGAAAGPQLTSVGAVVGTPHYMAPEQAGGLPVDPRADLFSLGCVAYTMLSGELAFPGRSTMAVLMALANHTPPPLAAVNPAVPPELSDLVARMMAKAPADRPGSAAEVIERLDAVLAAVLEHAPPPPIRASGAVGWPTRRVPPPASGSLVPASRPTRGVVPAPVKPSAAHPPDTADHHSDTAPRRPSRRLSSGTGPRAGAARRGRHRTGHPFRRPGHVRPARVREPGRKPARGRGRRGARARRRGGAALAERDDGGEREPGGGRDPAGARRGERRGRGARAARPVGRGGREVRPGGVRPARREVARREPGGGGLRVLDERQPQGRSARVRAEPGAAVLPGTARGAGAVAAHRLPRPGPEPAVDFLTGALGKKRLFLVGSDYVFPRTAHEIIRDRVRDRPGVSVVGEAFVPVGSTAVGEAVERIRACEPDAIVNTLNGSTNVPFFRALRAAGVTADRVPTMSVSIAENEVEGLNPSALAGDYLAAAYFQTVERAESRAFARGFRTRFGEGRVVSDGMAGAYTGVHLWAASATAAGTTDPTAVAGALRGRQFNGPRARETVDPDTQHAWLPVRIGRIRADGQVSLVPGAGSETPIKPEPFPASRARPQWEQLLRSLQFEWNGKWQAPTR